MLTYTMLLGAATVPGLVIAATTGAEGLAAYVAAFAGGASAMAAGYAFIRREITGACKRTVGAHQLICQAFDPREISGVHEVEPLE